VAGVVRVALAHVEHHQVGGAGRRARQHVLHRHERDLARGFVEELRDRLAAGAIRAQRLREVIRHPEAEGVHLVDERALLALLQARILGALLADRGHRHALVVVPGIDGDGVVEPEQLVEDAVVEVLGVAGRQIGAAGGEAQQRVTGEDAVGQHQ
jgi:hypothetical protein